MQMVIPRQFKLILKSPFLCIRQIAFQVVYKCACFELTQSYVNISTDSKYAQTTVNSHMFTINTVHVLKNNILLIF